MPAALRTVTVVAWCPFAARVRSILARHHSKGVRWESVPGPIASTFIIVLPRRLARTLRCRRRFCYGFQYGPPDEGDLLTPMLQHAVLAFVVLFFTFIVATHLWPELFR